MKLLEKVLKERVDELAEHVRAEVGFSPDEARRLVEQAAPALLESYRWNVARPAASPRFRSPPGPDYLARDLLEGVSGSDVAARAGISAQKGWEGLRALVPAVVRKVAEAPEEESSIARRARTPDDRPSRRMDVERLAVGFGLFVEGVPRRRADGSRGGLAFGHPIFDHLPFREDRPS